MLEPVKPLTTSTPSFCAARAVFFSSSAARAFDARPGRRRPRRGRQDRLVPVVDPIEHGLADQVGADGVDLQLVAFQQVAACRRNSRLRSGADATSK